MFGTKLRSWMEAHIVRSKKKKERKKGEKGSDSNCNSPRSHGSNRSPALYQVHPVDPVAKNVDSIRLHGEGGRCGTVSASSATSAGTGSVSLSSPESAYSTGYSTDGTSPGTSYPPEYYINIRTGTHYFQSNANATANANAVTVNTINNNNSNCNNNNSNQNRSKRPIGAPELPAAATTPGRRHGRFDASVDPTASTCGTAFVSRNASMDNDLSNDLSNGLRTSADSKIVERLGNNDGTRNQRTRSQAHRERCHRRTESFSAESSRSNLAGASSSVPPSLLSPTMQSPRERSRIRTNPWLSTNSSSSCTASFKYRLNLDDTSSGSGLRLTESSGSASDVNASITREDRTQRESKQESLSAGRSPINQNWRIASGMEIRPKISLSMQRRNSTSSSSSSSHSSSASPGPSNGSNDRSGSSSSSSSSRSSVNGNENGNEKGNDDSSAASVTRSVRSSEDDITLNEMMGKFDESYVYEKETDILSDSDPTDCEDYIESLSDVDAVRDGHGDERLDNDDLDYIDNGSFLDLHDLDCADRFTNTGHCTYFAFTGELARRASRLRESLMKRRNREDTAMPHRTIVAKSASRKQLPRHRRPTDELLPGEKRKKKSSQRRKSNLDKRDQDAMNGPGPDGIVVDDDDEETGNLNRVLVERMLLKNSGFNQGSRSVGGTPICLRRKKHDVNRNLSPMRSQVERPSTVRPDIGDPDIVDKRRSNSVSYVNGNVARRRLTTAGNPYMTTFASEIALLEADKEADRKYRELILEAENILANMQKSHTNVPIVPSPSRKFYYGLANKRVELIKNTELNIELALSKSRNSQPELQSGSIRDLEHTSPKRQQLVQSSTPFQRFQSSPVHRASPLVARREQSLEIQEAQRDTPLTSFNRNGVHVSDAGRCVVRPQASLLANVFPPRDSPCSLNRTEYRVARPPSASVFVAKEEGVTSSSSDSEDRCDVRRRPPLMTFRSVDMGPIKEGSSYCPQSEPVKRKVYAGSSTYGRIQKTLGENVTLRNSDGDTATDPDTDDSRRSLKEKVAKLRRERLVASPNGAPQDSQIFQQQLSQLRRQMLVQTIQGLKRSLEDQSATLKQSCLEPMMADRLP